MEVEVSVLLENQHSEDWIHTNADRISAVIINKSSTLLQLIELLGPVLTNVKPQIRVGGLLLLTSTLEQLPGDFLQEDEIELLVNFYTDRLRDHHSVIPQTLRGLLYLSKAVNLSKDQLQVLLDRLFREVMIQQQVVKDRAVVFNIISHILYHRSDYAKELETQITIGFLQAGEGEKDPRNLVLIFRCIATILSSFSVNHLREDIFESLAVYFPIDFTPPKGLAASVTKEDLVLSLRTGLTDPGLTEYSIPLFMEKLDSDLESAKIESVECLSELVARCSALDGGKEPWLKEQGKLLEVVWQGLKKELLGIRLQLAESIHKQIINLIQQISGFLATSSGGLLTPDSEGAWELWFSWIWRDIQPHLGTAGTRLISISLEVLGAIAGSGKAESKSVLTCSLPVLLKTWLSCPEDARNQFLSSTSQLMVSAANTGLVAEEDMPGLDELAKIFLLSGHLDLLAAAAGLLNPTLRNQLCESLLDRVQNNKPCGSALVHLARWDPEVVKTTLLPKFLELGDQGLEALSHLQEAGMLHLVLPPVAQKIKKGVYTNPGLYIDKLAQYNLTSSDSEKLTHGLSEILTQLLTWSDRPTARSDTTAAQDELKNYCTVISQLGSTVTEAATLHAMRLGDLVSLAGTHPGAGYEVEAVISGLPPSVLNQIPDILQQALLVPGCWRMKASLVNKLPHLADELTEVAEPAGVGAVCHALILNGNSRTALWTEKLLHFLHDKEQGAAAATCFSDLLSGARWAHPVSTFLYKQRAWSNLSQPLLSAAQNVENVFHLSALISLLPQIPRPLLEPVVPALLPLIARALGEGVTASPALSCLIQLMHSTPSLISSHIHDIVPRCLKLSVPPYPLKLRLQALVCLNKLGTMATPETVALAESVTSQLATSIKDHKRLVRQEAMRARNRWFLVTQP